MRRAHFELTDIRHVLQCLNTSIRICITMQADCQMNNDQLCLCCTLPRPGDNMKHCDPQLRPFCLWDCTYGSNVYYSKSRWLGYEAGPTTSCGLVFGTYWYISLIGVSALLVYQPYWCISLIVISALLVYQPYWCISLIGVSALLVHQPYWCISLIGVSALLVYQPYWGISPKICVR